MFESYSPLRVEQRKLQDRLAALERLTHGQTALQTTTKPEGHLSKGMHGWEVVDFFLYSEKTLRELRVEG